MNKLEKISLDKLQHNLQTIISKIIKAKKEEITVAQKLSSSMDSK